MTREPQRRWGIYPCKLECTNQYWLRSPRPCLHVEETSLEDPIGAFSASLPPILLPRLAGPREGMNRPAQPLPTLFAGVCKHRRKHTFPLCPGAWSFLSCSLLERPALAWAVFHAGATGKPITSSQLKPPTWTDCCLPSSWAVATMSRRKQSWDPSGLLKSC